MAYKKQDRFLRVIIHHLTAVYPSNEIGFARNSSLQDTANTKNRENLKDKFMTVHCDIMKPYTLDRGISWEVECLQSDQRLWRIDGIRPPNFNKESE
jgi:hypothetical protein